MLTQSQTGAKLDAEILAALEQLKSVDKGTEPYGKLITHIAQLHKLKIEEIAQTAQLHKQEAEEAAHLGQLESERRFGFSKKISPDTVLIVAANVFGILWLARYEREHVIKARSALGFVMKPRS